MASRTLQDLNLYPIVGKKEMKSTNAKYQILVGHWTTRNHLQDYKIYATVICMFDKDFLNSLL
jgi:hypothetical protein